MCPESFRMSGTECRQEEKGEKGAEITECKRIVPQVGLI